MQQKRPLWTIKMKLINRLTSFTHINLILCSYFITTMYCSSSKSSIIKFPDDTELTAETTLTNNRHNGTKDDYKLGYFDKQQIHDDTKEDYNIEVEDLTVPFGGYSKELDESWKSGSRHGRSPLKGNDGNAINGETAVQRVTFTQKGYIQFLKYVLEEVPTITEFTFCLWIRSYNFTYAHPILSYSKHEEDRYIRAWISPYGEEINLSLMEFEIFKIPVQLKEHHWYHVCQSWESGSGSWAVYLNGKLKASGQELKLLGLEIPSGGDMVVGQEYTDFDKGLDDGIEGDIYGFNLVLSAATTAIYRPWPAPPTTSATHNTAQPFYTATPTPLDLPNYNQYYLNEVDSTLPSSSIDNRRNIVILPPRKYLYTMNKHAQQQHAPAHQQDMVDVYSGLHRTKVHQGQNGVRIRDEFPYKYQVHKDISSVTQVPYLYNTGPPTEYPSSYEVPEVLSYFTTLGANRQSKGFMDFTGNMFNRMLSNIFNQNSNQYHYNRYKTPQITHTAPIDRNGVASLLTPGSNSNSKILTQPKRKTLGMALVELGYGNCALGKGSPVWGDRVLIGWMKTPVRVFGGAVLHTERAFCVKL